jgi:pyridoxine kinase
MENKRILTVQDISCVGQCSLTVALPILSACGFETAILPTALLSNHTAVEFNGFTFLDLTNEMEKIVKQWQKENIHFSSIYIGYLGNKKEVDIVKDIYDSILEPNGIKIVDPAMADNGKLYTGFDKEYVDKMKQLVFNSDIILPNISEACELTGTPYKEQYDEEYIKDLVNKLHCSGAKTVILTGVGYAKEYSGVVVSDDDNFKYYQHAKINKQYHGTGDIYSSVFTGMYLSGKSIYEAATIAADFVVECIKNTIDDVDHWYGVKFESVIPMLTKKL